MAEGGGAILAGEGGRLACEARIKFLARLTVQKLIEAQRFEQMTPAAPIDLSRHLRREMIERGHLDLAVRIAVPILMVHFREKGARQPGVAIAVFPRGIEVERATDAQCGGPIAQAGEAAEGLQPQGPDHKT